MVYDRTLISTDCATDLVRSILGSNLTVTGLRRLHGGMVNSVLELITDGRPRSIVAKLNTEVGHTALSHEMDVLRWHIRETEFPVPEPYGVDLTGKLLPGSALLMERLPGVNLGEARLSKTALSNIEHQMARHLLQLHDFTRTTYGSALKPEQAGSPRWLDVFAPRFRSNYDNAMPRLSGQARSDVQEVLDALPLWLPESGRPTLVHGDLWATNIIVDAQGHDGPRVSGYVDGGADFADVEYELAYLLVFNTVGRSFFEAYTRVHPLRPGFDLRRQVYWLNTMLLHVWAFGDDHYVQNAERLADVLARSTPYLDN